MRLGGGGRVGACKCVEKKRCRDGWVGVVMVMVCM